MDSVRQKIILLCVLVLTPWTAWATSPPVIQTDPIILTPLEDEGDEATSSDQRKISIKLEAAPTPAAWFQGFAGVEVRRQANPGQEARLSIRGADGQQILLLLDGVPLGGLLGGGADLSLLPLQGIERIHIQRGGLSARAGSDAMGGIVAVYTARLRRDPRGGLTLRMGSLGTGGVGLHVSGGGARLRAGVSGSLFTSRGDFSFEDDAGRDRVRENSDVERRQILLRVELGDEGAAAWRLTQHLVEIDRGIAGVAEFPSTEARQSARHLLSVLRYRQASFGRFRWSGHVAHRMEQSRFSDPAPAFPPAMEQRALMHAGYGAVGLDWLPNLDHRVELDLDARLDVGTVEDLGEPSVDLREHRFALALHETMFVDAFTFVAGARVESWDDQALEWAPRLSIRWDLVAEPGRKINLRLGGGRAYRVPSLSERWINLGSIRGNPDLLPEVGWSADLQLEIQTSRIQLRVCPFLAIYERSILFLPQSLYVVQAENARDARVYGAEVMAGWSPGGGQTLKLNYSYTHARFLDGEAPMPGRPTHSGGVSLAGAWTRWGYELSGRYRSAISLDRYGSLMEEAVFMMDASVHWRHRDLALVIRAENLLDVRDSVDHLQQPVPGRTIFALLRWERGGP